MSLLIGFLTGVLVLDCLLLILLVLVQLPKKEAGAGLAFGGGATDALFGAGSGNALTKITKYATVTFFVLCLGLSILQSRFYHKDSSAFKHALDAQQSKTPAAPAAAPGQAPASLPLTISSNSVPAPTPTTAPAPQK